MIKQKKLKIVWVQFDAAEIKPPGPIFPQKGNF